MCWLPTQTQKNLAMLEHSKSCRLIDMRDPHQELVLTSTHYFITHRVSGPWLRVPRAQHVPIRGTALLEPWGGKLRSEGLKLNLGTGDDSQVIE